jgi:cystinosin
VAPSPCSLGSNKLTFKSRSASFYPQPISNYLRQSTIGLSFDFPTLNILGFWCYTISTACFIWSPTIRSQYAYRHPEAPETTVRFNDFLFAAHGAVMCAVIYSQFFPQIWGFTVGRTQRLSQAVLGIFWGLVAGVVLVTFMAVFVGRHRGYDASDWAWIDVVSTHHITM